MFQTKASFPAPIPERIGAVGGIESIIVDERRYFFGFDYSSDLAVSPPIDDIDTMAAFASQYMEQRDGPHEPAYWRGLAEDAIGYSDLTSDPAGRVFSTADMRGIAATLASAQAHNARIPDFDIEYHMRYLLGAAAGWPYVFIAPRALAALNALRLDADSSSDSVDQAIAYLSGAQLLPANATYTDAALVLADYLSTLVNEAPGHWKTLFAPLRVDAT